jgi:acetyltransferase-like isoleucine patch superfamily enzyme
VGFASEVTRSYIGSDCWTHNNFVGDSIMQENVSFGVGTVLTNLKLDESHISSVIKEKKLDTGRVKLGAIIGSNVRVGSNCTIMPGVKIGSNSFIGAGVAVLDDLEDSQFLYLVQEQIKKTNQKTGQVTDRSDFKEKI